MHDIKAIRSKLGEYSAAFGHRGLPDVVSDIINADGALRGLKTEIDRRRADDKEADRSFYEFTRRLRQLNIDSDQPIDARSNEQQRSIRIETDQLTTEMKRIAGLKQTSKIIIPAIEALELKARGELEAVLARLPNIPASSTPEGVDETANEIVHTRGTPPIFTFTPLEHDTLALRVGYDPEAAARIAGSRFAVLKGPLARLHRALGQYMIDFHTAEHDYTEVAPPLLVRGEALFGTGQLPKFEEDLFKTTDNPPRYLIPTAEVSLTNLVREQILDIATLPLRFTALTPCFRSEAGSAGRDTRGLIRQHQFDKVELVSITTPEQAADEHERMTVCAETILDRLQLPYRRMLLCAGDMGFAARKTYDLEVWLPGQGQYREISSCSDCGDFQARRMDTRYRAKGEKGTRGFVHTLNGSALAVGRTLVAILENYQRADGSVAVPEVLWPYMGGVTELRPS